jgi:hypothetical protein
MLDDTGDTLAGVIKSSMLLINFLKLDASSPIEFWRQGPQYFLIIFQINIYQALWKDISDLKNIYISKRPRKNL